MIVVYRHWWRIKTYKDLFLKNLDDVEIVFKYCTGLTKERAYKYFDSLYNQEPMNRELIQQGFNLQAY